ncbi:hypothetical protein DFQ27_002670 [Actinomortierella ambigua]|uniref:Uncharacterized protein n=1 Tax=Actinomortierella ambigua TaxID=1343610 RepID=A0A9P6Q9U3_9FUNG|nr:hypothetical protein DFQ27_002670 [Actinomortierella ambigua]
MFGRSQQHSGRPLSSPRLAQYIPRQQRCHQHHQYRRPDHIVMTSSASASASASSSSPPPSSRTPSGSSRSTVSKNSRAFGGTSWSLPSGAIVDDRLREVVEALPHESALHSFIVEDVDALLALFDDAKDKEEITRTMLLAEKPSEEFRRVSHKCIAQVLDSCQRNGYAFLRQASEAWFNHNLRGFLPIALSAHPLFAYRPGEITSESLAHRRRKQDEREGRQYMGHKVDGMVVVRLRTVEICWTEAAKMDGGLNTTKSLHDTLKLMKLMKDGHDMVREKAPRCLLSISGIWSPDLRPFDLYRRRPGRFYQAVEKETISFPSSWYNKGDTTRVLVVTAHIFKLR